MIRGVSYGPDEHEELTTQDPSALPAILADWPVTWIDVDGLRDADLLRRVADVANVHPLALEDVVSLHQRPKVEPYGDLLFVVLRMLTYDEHLASEQLSVFLGKRFVLTFQGERPGDSLDPVRERIHGGWDRLRRGGADFLAYAIVDSVIDAWFPVLEALGHRLEELERDALAATGRDIQTRVHEIRHELVTFRTAVTATRDALSMLIRDESGLVGEPTKLFLRDCADHTSQILDALDGYREVAAGLLDVYLSAMSNRMNEVMKVLTMIATMFIPLTFVVGVYGMNFDPSASPWNMPELRWRYGYPFSFGVMGAIAVGLLWYFRAKGWLGGERNGAGS